MGTLSARVGESAAIIGCACSSSAVAQLCAPFWVRPQQATIDLTHIGGPNAVFDDGSGPALYTTHFYPDNGVARWRGEAWERLDSGLPTNLGGGYAFRALDEGNGRTLYFVGSYNSAAALWRWSGLNWVLAPAAMYGSGSGPLCSYDDGSGMAIYGIYWSGMAAMFGKWDGQQWTPVLPITPLGSSVYAQMQTADLGDGPAIYLLGWTSMPSLPGANHAAKWDGHQFTFLGDGFTGPSCDVRTLAVYDDGTGPELYVGGGFVGVGNLPIAGLAKWNGQRWAAVPGHSDGPVQSMTVFDDGAGPGLYVCGIFSPQGGVPCRNIARYDRTGWHALGDGVPGNSNYLAPFPQDPRGPCLFLWASAASGGVGGGLQGVGGDVQWVGCPNCYANCDNSTQPPKLNVLDFLCFLNKFAAADPYANCTVDATIDINDFMCFLTKFAAGCP